MYPDLPIAHLKHPQTKHKTMKHINLLRLMGKFNNVLVSLGTAIVLGGGLGWAGKVEAIGFNDGNGNGGVTFTPSAWGNAITTNPANPDPYSGSYGSVTINNTQGTLATLFGPDDGINLYGGSYFDYYYTASVDSMLSFSGWTFQSNDLYDSADDQAGYFVINGPYSQITSPTYLDGGPIVVPSTVTDPGPPPVLAANNNPVSSSSGFSQYLAPGDTFVFRVLSVANSTGEGDFTISDFDVQLVPFDFAPTYGVIFVGTALGINEWRKKRQALKKDETEEKL